MNNLNYRKLSQNLKSIVEQLVAIISDMELVAGDTTEAKAALVRAEHGLCCYCNEPYDDTKIFRGDHERCYKTVMRAIYSKVVTEDQAISRGWILPAGAGGRPRPKDDPIAQTITKQPVRKKRGSPKS